MKRLYAQYQATFRFALFSFSLLPIIIKVKHTYKYISKFRGYTKKYFYDLVPEKQRIKPQVYTGNILVVSHSVQPRLLRLVIYFILFISLRNSCDRVDCR